MNLYDIQNETLTGSPHFLSNDTHTFWMESNRMLLLLLLVSHREYSRSCYISGIHK